MMYYTGLGVSQDYVRAHLSWNLAAVRGESTARLRDFVAAKMTPAQLAEAQRRAAEWRPIIANAAPKQAALTATEPFEDGVAAYYKRGDYATALRIFRPLAEQGNTDAQFFLGLMYENGEGVPQDYAAAARWYRKAADQGNSYAQVNLGLIYESGRGIAQNYAAALTWYRKAADQGNAAAQFILGLMYHDGQGVPQNYAAAVSWFRKAADQGYAAAQSTLGLMYVAGRGVPQDDATAASRFQKAAGQGNAEAQVNLADAYAGGLGVPQDYAAAVGWYRKAAGQGDAEAQYSLWLMYHNGRGVPQDHAAAVSWFRKAAGQGYADAQSTLGFVYYRGQGVPQDYAAAVSWYRKAADQGLAGAQAMLGVMYGSGQGVPQDYVSAHSWLNLAAARGDKNAAGLRDIAAAKMTPAQLAEAQRRAAEWRPKVVNAAPGGADPAIPPAKKSSPEGFFGTAFFVSKDGKALTNAHVVEQCSQIRVTAGGQESAARIMARDEKNDLALLATGVKPPQLASWRLSVRQGEDIVVYGFPLPGVLASGGNVATGNITALAGLRNDSRYLQISAPVQQGNSGGPLLDRNGNVVGVVVSKLNALNVASVTGDIPQNVNFAIKASVAAAFLDAQHVAHTEGADAAALSTPDIAERANALTAQVICIR